MSITPATMIAPSVRQELSRLFATVQNACFFGSVAIVLVLWIVVSTSWPGAAGSSWSGTAIGLIVAGVGGVTAAGAGAAYHRSVVADVSGWRIAYLLGSVGLAIACLASFAAFGAVEVLDAFFEDFGSKAEQQRLRVIFGATFFGGAGTGFMLTTLVLQVGHAFASVRRRVAFAALVLAVAIVALPIASPWP